MSGNPIGIGLVAGMVLFMAGMSAYAKNGFVSFINTSSVHLTFSVDGTYACDADPGDSCVTPVVMGQHTLVAGGDDNGPSVSADTVVKGSGANWLLSGDETSLTGGFIGSKQAAQLQATAIAEQEAAATQKEQDIHAEMTTWLLKIQNAQNDVSSQIAAATADTIDNSTSTTGNVNYSNITTSNSTSSSSTSTTPSNQSQPNGAGAYAARRAQNQTPNNTNDTSIQTSTIDDDQNPDWDGDHPDDSSPQPVDDPPPPQPVDDPQPPYSAMQ